MDEPPPNKKQRKQHAAAAGERSPVADTAEDAYDGTTLLGLPGLPSGAIQQILDFQKSHKEHASLRLTSKRLCSEVDIFCKALLARLKKKHRVDDTFGQRIHDQTNLETIRIKPVILPFFYLLWKAMKTYLYKLESPERKAVRVDHDRDCLGLQLSESGDRITMTEEGDAGVGVQLWNLDSKQLLEVVDATDSHAEFLIDEWVVTCHGNEAVVRLWSQVEGALVGVYHIPNGDCHPTRKSWMKYEGMIFSFQVTVAEFIHLMLTPAHSAWI